jgi:hypothetical protein
MKDPKNPVKGIKKRLACASVNAGRRAGALDQARQTWEIAPD